MSMASIDVIVNEALYSKFYNESCCCLQNKYDNGELGLSKLILNIYILAFDVVEFKPTFRV